MYKKSLILVSIIFCIICISTFSFAADGVKNAMNGATNTVVDGVNRLGSDVRNGVGNLENGIEGAIDDMGDNNDYNNNQDATVNLTNDDNNDVTATTDYTATRTTADAVGDTVNTTTTWVWIILAVASVVIVGLVWYYATQNNND